MSEPEDLIQSAAEVIPDIGAPEPEPEAVAAEAAAEPDVDVDHAADETPEEQGAEVAAEGDAPADEEPAADPDEPPAKMSAKEWRALRRKEERAKRYKEEADSLYQQAQLAKQELAAERARLEQLRDPGALLEYMAKLQGKSTMEVYQSLTERVINDEEGKPVTQAELNRMVEERLRQEREAEHRRYAAEQHQTVEQYKKQLVDIAMDIPTDPGLSEEFPHLSILPDHELQEKVTFARDWAVKNQPDWTWRRTLKELDTVEGERLNSIVQKLNRRKGSGHEEAPAPRNRVSSVSNRDAVGGVRDVDTSNMDPLDRIAAAADVLPDLF